MTNTAANFAAHRPPSRRGSAYVFVLGICLIVTVLGMGALAVSRVSGKAAAQANDWEAAGALAFSATEQAMSVLNAAAAAGPATWRAAYTSGQTAVTRGLGRGTFGWALKDETDGNISADYLRPFRLYGIGTVGSVTRVYSVQVIPGGSPLDVLRTAIHSSSTLGLAGSAQAVNGPFSSNANVSLSGEVDGGIEAASTTGTATGTQSITAPAPAKTMPSAAIFDDLSLKATAISYSALSSGKLQNCLLSAASNPYGALNPSGLYSIALPGNATLTISNCRIVGTLLVLGANKNTINVQGPVEWEPGSGGGPILVISAKTGTIKINGSSTWLSESSVGVNLNPSSTPFQGQSDTDLTDDFPPQYRGIVHVIGDSSSVVQIGANAYFIGTVIATCPVTTNGQSTFVQSPAIYASPPLGYAVGDAMTEVPGTWVWDTLPSTP